MMKRSNWEQWQIHITEQILCLISYLINLSFSWPLPSLKGDFPFSLIRVSCLGQICCAHPKGPLKKIRAALCMQGSSRGPRRRQHRSCSPEHCTWKKSGSSATPSAQEATHLSSPSTHLFCISPADHLLSPLLYSSSFCLTTMRYSVKLLLSRDSTHTCVACSYTLKHHSFLPAVSPFLSSHLITLLCQFPTIPLSPSL